VQTSLNSGLQFKVRPDSPSCPEKQDVGKNFFFMSQLEYSYHRAEKKNGFQAIGNSAGILAASIRIQTRRRLVFICRFITAKQS